MADSSTSTNHTQTQRKINRDDCRIAGDELLNITEGWSRMYLTKLRRILKYCEKQYGRDSFMVHPSVKPPYHPDIFAGGPKGTQP